MLAREHHEHWDGTGYPRGLKGKEINLFSRITAIADVYDALRGTRCYKEPWPLEEVLEKFKNERGKHFDPDLVDTMLASIPKFEAIICAYPDYDF
jgi:HD-GYP domain-containing protein (c-di-GMP phosphodiesterase class II)